jgi:transposase-like protein
MARNKTYSKELKEEVVGKVREGFGLSETGTMYGISPSTISGWLGRSAEGRTGDELQIGKLKRENEALLRIIGQLTYESELKKKRLSA